MKYIFAFICGLILVPTASATALVDRGYTAVGGEVLIPVLFVLIVCVYDSFKEALMIGGTKDERRAS